MAVPLMVLAALAVSSAWGGWPKLIVKPHLADYAMAGWPCQETMRARRAFAGEAAAPWPRRTRPRGRARRVGGAGGVGEGASARGEGAGEEPRAATEHRAQNIAMCMSIAIAAWESSSRG